MNSGLYIILWLCLLHTGWKQKVQIIYILFNFNVSENL